MHGMKSGRGLGRGVAVVAAVVAGIAALASDAAAAADGPADRPNFVWLMSEDNSSSWYRLYDERGRRMPHVEALAEHGLTFANAYSCGPVCSTARSSLISGCYVSRLGAQYHRPQLQMALPPGVKPFPWYLKQAGYYTTNNDKTDYNFEKPITADAWHESSKKATYKNRAPGQPFFHVQTLKDTHEGRLFEGRSAKADTPASPADVALFPYHPDTPLFREKYADYLTLHSVIDDHVGRFVAELEEQGLLDDTFVFQFGDHGGVLPGSKGYARNDGLHVALVVYVPKNWRQLVPAEPGTRLDGVVEFVDLSATVLNLAGVAVPAGIDGRPVLGPGVSCDDLDSRNEAFGYADRFDEKYDFVRFLRKGRFSYHRRYQPFNFDGLHNGYRYRQPAYRQWRDLFHAGSLNAVQRAFFEPASPEALFDLEQDPHETHNLADDPAYHDTLVDLRETLQRRLRAMPDLGFIPEPVLLAESKGDGFGYGQRNRSLINELLDIADLQLEPFEVARPVLKTKLTSANALERYWALISCSVFGEQAEEFFSQAQRLAASDANLLVRCRAAEFLAIAGQQDPRPVLTDVLNACTDPVAANLILNTVVLLRDREPGFPFDFSTVENATWATAKPGRAMVVQRRIDQFREAE